MIEDTLNRALRKEEEEPHRSSGKLSPSLACGCDRKTLFTALGQPPTTTLTDRMLRLFQVGHLLEKFVLDFLPADLLRVERDVAVTNACWCGRIDAIVTEIGTDLAPKPPYILEVKSIHSGAFWRHVAAVRKADEEHALPYLHHLYQVAIYQWLHPQPGEPHILYVSKDDLAMAEFVLSREDDRLVAYELTPRGTRRTKAHPYGALVEKRDTLARYLTERRVPEVPFATPDAHPWLCQRAGKANCPYYGLCWPETKEVSRCP